MMVWLCIVCCGGYNWRDVCSNMQTNKLWRDCFSANVPDPGEVDTWKSTKELKNFVNKIGDGLQTS